MFVSIFFFYYFGTIFSRSVNSTIFNCEVLIWTHSVSRPLVKDYRHFHICFTRSYGYVCCHFPFHWALFLVCDRSCFGQRLQTVTSRKQRKILTILGNRTDRRQSAVHSLGLICSWVFRVGVCHLPKRTYLEEEGPPRMRDYVVPPADK